jgi:hypothetical protein
MHNFSVWNPLTHNREPHIDYKESLLHHRHLIKLFPSTRALKDREKGDPKLIHTTMYLVSNISRNTNKT